MPGDVVGPDDQTRLVFVCYPHETRNDVIRFEAALTEKLGIRSRKYEIFRDKGSDERRRIDPGKIWRDVVRDNLKAARCCIVVVVPTIFESKECREEITLFQRSVEADPQRFFFPIDFTEVQDRIAQLVRTGDQVARLMDDLDRHDFVAAVHEPNELLYKDKVDDIAKRIDRRFERPLPERKPRPSGTPAPHPPRPSRPSQSPWRAMTAAAAAVAAVAIVVGGTWWLLQVKNSTPVNVGERIDLALDVVLPTPLRTYPSLNAPAAREILEPRLIKAGERNILAIRQGKANGVDWYQLDFEKDVKRYVETQRIPTWTPLDPNIELVRTINTRERPQSGAKPATPLPPGSLAPSRQQFGPHRTARVDKVLWYRIRRSPTEDAYFSEQDAASKLATWVNYSGCLQTIRKVRARTAIFDGDEADPYSEDQRVLGALQIAEVDRQKWVRYRRQDGSFNYLSFGELRVCRGS